MSLSPSKFKQAIYYISVVYVPFFYVPFFICHFLCIIFHYYHFFLYIYLFVSSLSYLTLYTILFVIWTNTVSTEVT